MKFFVIGPDGAKYGPADLATLNEWIQQARLTPESALENADTGEQVKAGDVPGLNFSAPAPSAGATPTETPTTTPMSDPVQPAAAQGAYENPPSPTNYPRGGGAPSEPIPNHLVKSILATLCCCLPLGIVAIVFSAQVNGQVQSGDYVTAQETSEKASKWGNIAIIVGVIVNIISVILQFTVFAGGLASSGGGF